MAKPKKLQIEVQKVFHTKSSEQTLEMNHKITAIK